MSEEKKREGMLYPHNVLEAFGNGCLMDLRVRLAINLLQHSPIFHGAAGAAVAGGDAAWSRLPNDIAKLALATADELLRLGEEAGMVKPLPDTAELPAAVRNQAKRTARFQVLQQLEGQRAMADEQNGGLAVAGTLPFPGRKPS